MRYAPIQTACPTRDPRSLTLSPRQTFLLIFSLRAHAWCQHADLSGVSTFAAANFDRAVSVLVSLGLICSTGAPLAETIFSISLTWHELTHHGRSAQDAGGLKRPMLYH